MLPLLFALQTDFDAIWLNCTEEQIEQVQYYFYRPIRDATLTESDFSVSIPVTVTSWLI